jgi:uncharacterized protein (DUF2267 family)
MALPSGIDLVDRSNEKTYAWLNDLAAEMGASERHEAYRVLRAFLQLVRDRITVDEGAQLAAQLPHFLRGLFYEDWRPRHVPETYRDHDTFLRLLADRAQLAGETQASIAAEAAAKVMRRHIDEGQFAHVLAMLPDALEPLFAPDKA